MEEERPTAWLENWRRGDQRAADKLFAHFSERLCQLAHRHLSARTRQRVDGDDVVQSVFRTFFTRDSQGQFAVDHSDELWRLLVKITLRKARGVWRRNAALRRTTAKETPLAADEAAALWAKDPTVVDALVLADEIETLLAGLSEQHGRALELRLTGHTPTEAADCMGLSRQAFYRLLDPLKQRLLEREQQVAQP